MTTVRSIVWLRSDHISSCYVSSRHLTSSIISHTLPILPYQSCSNSFVERQTCHCYLCQRQSITHHTPWSQGRRDKSISALILFHNDLLLRLTFYLSLCFLTNFSSSTTLSQLSSYVVIHIIITSSHRPLIYLSLSLSQECKVGIMAHQRIYFIIQNLKVALPLVNIMGIQVWAYLAPWLLDLLLFRFILLILLSLFIFFCLRRCIFLFDAVIFNLFSGHSLPSPIHPTLFLFYLNLVSSRYLVRWLTKKATPKCPVAKRIICWWRAMVCRMLWADLEWMEKNANPIISSKCRYAYCVL